jgi:hypothetical protein
MQGVQHGDQNLQQNYFAPITIGLFAGAFERLQDVCFDPAVLERDLDLARFTGREWLVSRIDEFITTRSRGYVIVQAEAGVGKSSLAAHLVGVRPWLHHFTRLPGGRSPEAARKSLAAQLIARWDLDDWAPGGILPGAAERPDWFDRLLHSAARRRDEQEPGIPIVLVVDGLDEAEAGASVDTGLPLGLPTSLPDGVFVVATSRFGIDRALQAIRNPADWLQIEVEGPNNLDDMRRFIREITDPQTGDQALTEALKTAGVNISRFRRTLADRCAGVWIYLRYVLDEIRDGTRDARQVNRLPGDLAGYYAQQINRWRGDPANPASRILWQQIYLPLLGVLAAARGPLTIQELTKFSGVAGEETIRAFVEETARAFLNRHRDEAGETRYVLRHQSLRDLLTGVVPDRRPDLEGLAGGLAAQTRLSHQMIAASLIPPEAVGERSWQGSSPYARDYLAAHAAACGLLDDLINDPGFLTVARPDAVLAQRGNLHSHEGERALAAFEMSLNGWTSCGEHDRVERLAANAARVNADSLHDVCTKLSDTTWPIRWAAWSGRSHRTLAGHGGWVNAVAIGRADDRDIIGVRFRRPHGAGMGRHRR